MNIVELDEAEIFNPQRDLEFEMLEEEKGEEIALVPRQLTLSQIRERLANANNPYKLSID